MMEALRGFVGGWVAKIFLGLLIASFAVWGIAGEIFNTGDANTVASVGETRVPAQQFAAVYYNNLNTASARFGRRLTQDQARAFGVEAQTVSQLVSGATFDEYARLLGVELSDDELRRLLAEETAFQDTSGVFDRNRFQEAVRNAQMNEASFVDQQDRAALRQQVASALSDGKVLPSAFVDAAAVYRTEARSAEAVVIDANAAGFPAEPSDAELQAFFEANKPDYRAPEYRTLSIVVLDPTTIANESDVTDAEVEAEYARRLPSYTTAERRSVEQIAFPDRAAADAARKALDEGALFETVRSEAGVSEADSALGVLRRDQLPDPAIAEAAFTASLNTPSAVVDGRFGPAIVRAVSIEPEVVIPLEEVRATLRTELAVARAAQTELVAIQEAIEDARAGGDTLREAATANQVDVRTIEAVDARGQGKDGNVISDIPSSADLLRAAFAASQSEDTAALRGGSNGLVWFEVEAIEAERDRTFEESRADVLSDWTADQQEKLLNEAARAAETALGTDADISSVAAERGGEVATFGPLARDAAPGALGAEGLQALFAGPVGHVAVVSSEGGAKRIVLRVTAIDAGAGEAIAAPQVEALNDVASDDLLGQMLGNLQSRYGARVNQQVVRTR